MKKLGLILCTMTALTVPAASNAQLGGMLKKSVGLGGGGANASAGDSAQFLDNAFKASVNTMIAADVLAKAVQSKGSSVGSKDYVNGLMKAQSFKEVDAFTSQFQSNIEALGKNDNVSQDLIAAHGAASAKQKKLISTALFNIALATFRNVQMAQQAPGFVRSIASDPKMLGRLGEFKAAAALLGLQAKGLGVIAPSLPKVLSATKVQPPEQSEATKPQEFDPSAFPTD